jgi:hypothetical protein
MDYVGAFAQGFIMVGGWLIAGFAACIPTFLVIRWWSEGVISVTEGLGFLSILGLMVLLMIGPTPAPIKTLLFFMIIGVSVAVPLALVGLKKKSENDFENEKEAVYRAALSHNPKNIAARVELARSLYLRGRASEGIEELEAAVQMSPQTTENERLMLNGWRDEQAAKPNAIAICRWCREDTPGDRPVCKHCGRPLSAYKEVAEAVMEDIPGTLRKFMIIIPALLLGGFFISLLSPLAANILILMVITGGMVWIWYRL